MPEVKVKGLVGCHLIRWGGRPFGDGWRKAWFIIWCSIAWLGCCWWEHKLFKFSVKLTRLLASTLEHRELFTVGAIF
jgi:hypothetical protein